MPLYNFFCGNSHIHEVFTKDITEQHLCPICNTVSVYKPTMPHIGQMKMGLDPKGCPTAADKWAKAHEKGGVLT